MRETTWTTRSRLRTSTFLVAAVLLAALASGSGPAVAGSTRAQPGTEGSAAPAAVAGPTVYVANSGSSNVTRIPVATNTPGPPITLGASPNGIAVTPDGVMAYVATSGNNSVIPLELTTNTAGTVIAVGDSPFDIAITADGATAYVTNYNDSTVTRMTCRIEGTATC